MWQGKGSVRIAMSEKHEGDQAQCTALQRTILQTHSSLNMPLTGEWESYAVY